MLGVAIGCASPPTGPDALEVGMTRTRAVQVAGEPSRRIETRGLSTWRWERPGYLVDLMWQPDDGRAYRRSREAQP